MNRPIDARGLSADHVGMRGIPLLPELAHGPDWPASRNDDDRPMEGGAVDLATEERPGRGEGPSSTSLPRRPSQSMARGRQ